jgi:uncharacterized protein YbjT (DUF2867 family)
MTVLTLTGATGQVGSRVAQRLGPLVSRLVVRDLSRAPRLSGSTPEVRQADYGDAAAASAALAGTDVLFMVSAAEAPDRREQHRTFIQAAGDAGVRHIVYTSFDGAAPEAVFTLGRDHWDAEQAIRQSGMAFTFLRDNFYSDVLPMFADDEGVIRGPAGDGRLAAVARADVADVAVAVLQDPAGHEGATHHLTGPEALSFPEAAQRMGAVLGRPFRFVDESVEQAYASRRSLTDQQWQLDAWVSTYLAAGSGELARVSQAVPMLTGHPARTIEQALVGGG